jgi:hypothetical protein
MGLLKRAAPVRLEKSSEIFRRRGVSMNNTWLRRCLALYLPCDTLFTVAGSTRVRPRHTSKPNSLRG